MMKMIKATKKIIPAGLKNNPIGRRIAMKNRNRKNVVIHNSNVKNPIVRSKKKAMKVITIVDKKNHKTAANILPQYIPS